MAEVAQDAGGCSLHDLLQQHVKEKPHGAEHRLSKRMLLKSINSSAHLLTFQEYQESIELAGGAEDTAFCAQADWLRQTILEKIDANLESFGLVELEQIHAFTLLVDFHQGRAWGVKLLPTSAAASSETEDLTPVEDSDEEIEKLRQAWLEASTKARKAKKDAKAAFKNAEQQQKALHTAWRAFTSAQEVVRESKLRESKRPRT